MKRFLKNDQYQLNLREQEELWHNIQTKTGRGASAPGPRRRFVIPAFGMTAVTAAVLLAAVWLNQPDAPEKIAQQARQPEPRIDTRQQKAEPAPADVAAVPDDEEPPVVERKDLDTGKEAGSTLDQQAVQSVEKALRAKEGITARQGELYVRGGRSGDKVTMDAVPPVSARARREHLAEVSESLMRMAPTPQAPGSVTGGTTPPNGQAFELMYFQHTGVNPFVATEEDALSTFAVDVDNASYTLTRNYLQRYELPPQDAIRVEEFVNFFGGGYPDQTEDVFAIHTDGAPSRFGQGYQLLRVGLKGMTVAAENRKPANLIFVIDVSGSMARENRLDLVKKSLRVLLGELQEGDRVGIVVYGSQGRVILEPTGIEQRERIAGAIDALTQGGSTNVCEGLELAYQQARQAYDPGLINRIILCSDGVANMGSTTRAEEMLATVRRSTDQGITLSTVGFGMGNYNDVLMEKLADQGDGNYSYVDDLPEAERVFRENLTGMLQTIARQVKIQVEFNPDRVQRWRLLGYENRDVADRDFRNDAVDAGEVGAGHEVTALYELKVTGKKGDQNDATLGTVRVRYEYPTHDTARAGQVKETEHPIRTADLRDEFSDAPLPMQLQALAAEFAEILRGSFWAKESRLIDLVPVADGLAKRLDGNAQAAELAQLIRQAADLEAARAQQELPAEKRD